MIDSFNSLGQLMRYYEESKFEMRSCSTLLPKKEQTFQKGSCSIASKLSREDKFALIADVESFIKYKYDKQKGPSPISIDCLTLIFHVAFNFKSLVKRDTYGKLAQHFRSRIRNNEKIPRRLQDRNNIGNLGREIRRDAYKYFTKNGLVVENL